MATTLTLYLGVWPRAYLLQVGDSRCYVFRDGELTQLTRDQTMAQELVDLGVLKPADASGHPAGPHPLQRHRGPNDRPRGHPPEHELGHRRPPLQRRPHRPRVRRADPGAAPRHDSARQACEDLLRDALDAGGTDNVTIIVARTIPGNR